MPARIVIGANGPTLAAPALGGFIQDGSFTGHKRAGALRRSRRCLIPRMLVGLPVSTWMLLDALILSGALWFAYKLYPPPELLATPHIGLLPAIVVFTTMLTIAALIFGLHERETIMSRSRIATRLMLTAVVATAMTYAVVYVLMYATVSRRATGATMTAFVLISGGIRLGAWWAIHRVHLGVLVVGRECLYRSFQQARERDEFKEYRLVGFASHDSGGTVASDEEGYLGPIVDLVPKLDELMVTDVVVGAEAAGDARAMEWMVPCLQRGCRVTNEAIFFEKATGQILVDEVTPLWFLFADLKINCDRHAMSKRAIDVLAAVVGLCLFAPLWPLIALAIKLCDGGPVFYSQSRVGQNGQLFKLHKFRTMRPDAETGKSIWAYPDDPRVTRVGRLLRKLRLDELPQLYNVLMGRMSIIGPRPERPDIVDELCKELPYYAERHLVKPGITGWAQISFRYGSSIEDAKRKLQYDLYYLKHMSLELDVMILLRTIGTFIRGAC